MAIFTARHPSRFAELLKYAETIRLAAAQFPGFGWRSYDEQFRLRQEANPSRSWAVLDMELWVTVAAASSLLPMATTTTSTAFSAGKNTQSKQSSCFSFNSTNGCRWNPCKYAHRCNRCARFGHGAATCRVGSGFANNHKQVATPYSRSALTPKTAGAKSGFRPALTSAVSRSAEQPFNKSDKQATFRPPNAN